LGFYVLLQTALSKPEAPGTIESPGGQAAREACLGRVENTIESQRTANNNNEQPKTAVESNVKRAAKCCDG